MFKSTFALIATFVFSVAGAQKITEVDICVYGGTAAGVIAAYTAKKLHKTVLLIEPGKHLGGLTTGGLGFTDIGNKYAISGLSRDFYRRIGKHYGKFEQWIFEPSVAENTLLQYINSAAVPVLYSHRLNSVKKEGRAITSINVEHSENSEAPLQTIKATVFLDCSYEGDLMAKAGVSYIVGREANAQYKETYNGVQLRNKHQFPDGVDPYKIKGDATSGLLWGISALPPDATGSGDKKVQAYNFRVCLSNDPANRINITKPEGYDPSRYELLVRYLEQRPAKNLHDYVLKMDRMPNNKTDINNNGPFSTDMIGANYDFPEADYKRRNEIQKEHELYIKGLLYFIGHDSRIPKHLQTEMLQWGYPKDEYVDNNHWSPQMYVREARRMIGSYIMTQHDCEGREVVTDGVGMAAYTMDSHNCQRVVVNGMVKNEGDVQVGGFGPYPVSYRSLVPKKEECTNLLVPVCLSATHIAYGSIRMEPVFMVLAQSAATAAVQAIDKRSAVQDIDVKQLKAALADKPLADDRIAEILVDNDDEEHTMKVGEWKRVSSGGYGPSLLVDSSKGTGLKAVRFTPNIKWTGSYSVYAYFPKLPQMTRQTVVTLYDGKQKKETTIREGDIRVEGQTSGEWVSLGSMHLSKGKKGYIEVSNKGADGLVVADAILFVPGKK
ncbi:MAG TPA: FAD-dependent oxidoreductase [Chitinophagaceae bacterium]|nr:FAD-dependent oxidoreductase [Chitinophagaceae bacterium]